MLAVAVVAFSPSLPIGDERGAAEGLLDVQVDVDRAAA